MPNTRLPDIIGSALKLAREKRGMERAELAKLCCLSNKMVLELEEGGMTAFYSFQLKLSSAKRVGSFLGLSPSDYLGQVVEAVEAVEMPESLSEADDLSVKKDEKQVSLSAQNTVVNEAEHLDDLIYGSTHSGTSLPHFNTPSVPVKKIGLALGLLIALGAIYGIDNKLRISNQALALLEQGSSKKDEQEADGGKLLVKTELKPEPVLASTPSQSQCSPVRDDQLSVYKSPNPSKLGDAVNIKTLIKQSICVVDGQGKQTLVDLEPNTAHSFRGSSPFVVSAQDLDNLEMYYQGWRVRPPNPGAKQIRLVEVSIQ
jgi:transcriptional regulator with XRE-family HTH domain